MDFGAALGNEQRDGEVLPAAKMLSLEAAKPAFTAHVAAVEKMVADARALIVKDDGSLKFAVALGGEAKKIARALEAKASEVTEEASSYVKAVNGFVKLFTERLVSNTKKTNADCIEAVLKKKIGDYQVVLELERRAREEAARRAQEELQAKLRAEAEEANRRAREEAARRAQEEARKNSASEAEIAAAKRAAEEEAAKHAIEAPVLPEPVFQPQDTITRAETGAAAFTKRPWVFDVLDLKDVPEKYITRAINAQAVREDIKQGIREIPGLRIYQDNQINFRA